MDWLAQLQGLNWEAAVAVLAAVAACAIVRKWRRNDEARKLYKELQAKYDKAVDDRNLDLAAAIGRRMQELKKHI